MNSFIPENPKVVIGLFNDQLAVASNIHPNLEVHYIYDLELFEFFKQGLPFDNRHPNPQLPIVPHKS